MSDLSPPKVTSPSQDFSPQIAVDSTGHGIVVWNLSLQRYNGDGVIEARTFSLSK